MTMIKRVLVTCGWLALPVLVAAQQTPGEFKPFDESAPRETLPAAPLVFVAYSLAWIAVTVYAFNLWRKLGKAEQDLAELRRQLKK